MLDEREIYDLALELTRRAATTLPTAVEAAIRKSQESETEPMAHRELEIIVANLELAAREGVSLCQDPGIPVFHVGLGSKYLARYNLPAILTRAVETVTREVPLRQNIVHPLTRHNSGTNTGWRMPFIYYDYRWDADYLELTAMFRGGGAALRSAVFSVAPTVPRGEGIKKIVFDMVTMAGGIPCPPTVVGVGAGGTPDVALYLAFEALRRTPVGSAGPDPEGASIERDLFQVLNDTGLGPMGIGGRTSVLGVHLELCGSHTASMPVAVAFSCWTNRYATCRVHQDGQVEWVSHGGGENDGP